MCTDTTFYVQFKEVIDIQKLKGPWNPDRKLLSVF